MQNVEIQIHSRQSIQTSRFVGRWACIQIATHKDTWPQLQEENLVDKLQLFFYDLGKPVSTITAEELFTEKLAEQVFHFVESVWDDIDILVVHCEAGVSRSAAIAAAVHKYKSPKTFKFEDYTRNHCPNNLVYRICCEVFERNLE